MPPARSLGWPCCPRSPTSATVRRSTSCGNSARAASTCSCGFPPSCCCASASKSQSRDTTRSSLGRRTAAVALAVCTGLCGCSRGGAETPAHVLRVAYAGDPGSLVPFVAVDQEIIATATLFCQTLVGLSAENRDVPILVTRIPSRKNGDVSRDGTRIVYHLRHGVRFADGVELTSADVA